MKQSILLIIFAYQFLLLLLQQTFPIYSLPVNQEMNKLDKILQFTNRTDRSIIQIIDQIINFGSIPKCATGQGQAGFCTIGSCPNLGNYTSVGCKGKSRFIKCCPMEAAVERFPLDSLKCGKQPDLPGDLIVGGHEARPHSWPWAVALYRIRQKRKFFQCGASIISQDYVLTAAHCVYRDGEKVLPTDYLLQIGAHNLAKSGEFVEIKEIIVHENYSPQYHNDDIALLRLKVPLDFNKNKKIAPVCLPEKGSKLGRQPGTLATMIGWGVRDPLDFTPSNTLYQVQVPTVKLDHCTKVYDDMLSSNYYFNWQNVICASNREGGRDTCQGDSGGPMLISKPNERYYQVGVVSFGYGCAEKGYPGVYTYVPHYLNWIGAHIHKAQ